MDLPTLQTRSKSYMSYKQKKHYWANIITCWFLSGLTPRPFCEKYNLKVSDFRKWRFKLSLPQPLKQSKDDNVIDFIPITIDGIKSEIDNESDGIVLILSNGSQLGIKDGFNESTLIRLLSVLGGSIC
jgi:hypothetical protein